MIVRASLFVGNMCNCLIWWPGLRRLAYPFLYLLTLTLPVVFQGFSAPLMHLPLFAGFPKPNNLVFATVNSCVQKYVRWYHFFHPCGSSWHVGPTLPYCIQSNCSWPSIPSLFECWLAWVLCSCTRRTGLGVRPWWLVCVGFAHAIWSNWPGLAFPHFRVREDFPTALSVAIGNFTAHRSVLIRLQWLSVNLVQLAAARAFDKIHNAV